MENGSSSDGIAILIVEDDISASNILTQMISLEFPHVAMDVAYSGEEGLSLCRQRMHHIVVSDIQMSGMDGISMAEEIRSSNPAAKLIFMTGYRNLDDMARLTALGAIECIVKPVDLTRLFNSIKTCINQVRQEPGDSLGHP